MAVAVVVAAVGVMVVVRLAAAVVAVVAHFGSPPGEVRNMNQKLPLSLGCLSAST